MSSKVARKVRKGYNAAGALYWTADMEKAIKKIRRERNIYRISCAISIVIIAVEALALFGVI